MITRIWHGRTSLANADNYLSFLLSKGTDEYRQTEGNLSVKVWNLKDKDCCHFWTVTEWEDLSAVKAFAGKNYSKAKYYPEDQGILLEFEEKVNHYESADLSNTRIKSYVNQFQELFNGGSWLDESFTGKLEDIDQETAFQRPYPEVHSLAELVWHTIYWRTTLIKNMQGEFGYRDATVDKLNFLPIAKLKAKGWDNLMAEFTQSQNLLTELLSSKKDSFLSNEYKKGYTFGYLIEGVIQHDAYHLGQMGLIIKMLSSK